MRKLVLFFILNLFFSNFVFCFFACADSVKKSRKTNVYMHGLLYNAISKDHKSDDAETINKYHKDMQTLHDSLVHDNLLSYQLNNDSKVPVEKIFVSKKEPQSDLQNSVDRFKFSDYYFNTNNSFYKKDHFMSRNAIFVNISFLNFNFDINKQVDYGNYNNNLWKSMRGDVNSSWHFDLQVGIDYSFSVSKVFHPLIGGFFEASFPTDFDGYKKDISGNREDKLKSMYTTRTVRLDYGAKIGNFFFTERGFSLLYYISGGYSVLHNSFHAEYMTGDEDSDDKKLIDSKDNNFVFGGVGLDFYYRLIKVGIFLKAFYPIHDLCFKDVDNNIINFGKILTISFGVSFGFTFPILF